MRSLWHSTIFLEIAGPSLCAWFVSLRVRALEDYENTEGVLRVDAHFVVADAE